MYVKKILKTIQNKMNKEENINALKEYINLFQLMLNNGESIIQNKDEIIDIFIQFFNNIEDENDVEFEGDGSYFGKQINIMYNRYSYNRNSIFIEIAYSYDKISIYTAEHNGFWVPEYIKIDKSHKRFKELQNSLYDLLRKVFGVPIYNYELPF